GVEPIDASAEGPDHQVSLPVLARAGYGGDMLVPGIRAQIPLLPAIVPALNVAIRQAPESSLCRSDEIIDVGYAGNQFVRWAGVRQVVRPGGQQSKRCAHPDRAVSFRNDHAALAREVCS